MGPAGPPGEDAAVDAALAADLAFQAPQAPCRLPQFNTRWIATLDTGVIPNGNSFDSALLSLQGTECPFAIFQLVTVVGTDTNYAWSDGDIGVHFHKFGGDLANQFRLKVDNNSGNTAQLRIHIWGISP